jgi:signal transduction histidine kinase
MNITDRKKAEIETLKHIKELKKLNAEKDKFFSIIAHDLKSPFNSILGFSELLLETVKKKDCESINEYSDIINKSSKRAMNLLENLVEWSLSQTGRMNFNPEYLEMVNLINEIVLLFSDMVKQKSIKIIKELPKTALLFADKAMINTVLRNLISNAIKFTNPGGEIKVTIHEKQNELLISVMDTGVGIKKDRFEELFQIDKNHSTQGTKNEKGTGLGLILCKEFIEKHEGKLWIESEVDKGSTFYFTIPNDSRLNN